MFLKNGKLSTQNIKLKLEGKFAMVIHSNLASYVLLNIAKSLPYHSDTFPQSV